MTAAIRTSETTTGKVLRSPPASSTASSTSRAKREAEQDPGKDLLGQLLTSRDETTGAPLSRKEIRDEATGYLFAAQDTTGLTLS